MDEWQEQKFERTIDDIIWAHTISSLTTQGLVSSAKEKLTISTGMCSHLGKNIIESMCTMRKCVYFVKKILLANSHHYPLIGLPTRDTIICRSNLFGRNTALYHTHGISNANPILLCILFIERSEHKRRPTQNTMTTKRLIFNTKKMIGLGWNGDDASSRYYSKVLFAKENQRIV